MSESINNLNNVVRERENMVSRIIHAKHKPKGDAEHDRLERKYNAFSYQKLKRLTDEL